MVEQHVQNYDNVRLHSTMGVGFTLNRNTVPVLPILIGVVVALLTLRSLTMAFGGPPILDGVDLQVEPGDRLCLVGRNGSGKSTLLRLMNGELAPDTGEIFRQQGLRVALVAQDVPPALAGTVFDVVAAGMGNAAEILAEYHRVSHRLAMETSEGLLARLERLHKTLEDTGGWSLHQEVERVLSRLSLNPDAEFVNLSGGTKRRVLLARALVAAPDILLLDEPTNQLDIGTIIWLEEFLFKHIKTVVFVTHDRAFARRLANRVVELDRGALFAFACGYDLYEQRREALLESEATRLAQLDKKLAQEEAWVRQGIKARRTRNEGRVRALQALREERRQQRDRTGQVRLQISGAEQSGRLVVQAKGVSFAYDERWSIRDLTTTIMRGDKVGIIGPNGSGKTTLLRLLVGDLTPQGGTIRFGGRLEVLYFDQLREQLDLQKTVWENVGDGSDTVTVNGEPRHIMGYLQDFLFTPQRAQTPVHILSGAERNRLLLAKLFARPCNVLVMDEPTNDLDAETLDLLEDLLLEYSGTLLLVSHDRDFLNNAVTSTLSVAADGTVREFAGGYDDWLRVAQAEAQADAHAAAQAAAEAEDRVASPREKKAAKGPKRQAERPRKLTFKEARELEALPARIEALEKEREELHAALSAPEIYRSGGATVAGLNARREELERELDAAFIRWNELESVRG
jgi:ABC transport system ATP-binding/permease protein